MSNGNFLSDHLDILVIGVGLLVISLAAIRFVRWIVSVPALAVTPIASRWLSHIVGRNDLQGEAFFNADQVPLEWVEKRRVAFESLMACLNNSNSRGSEIATGLQQSMSDLRFADANRVPFPFARYIRERCDLAVVATETRGPRIIDEQGRELLDVSGSYGVNVAGYDRYKAWQRKGLEKVADLGPVLGPLHPVVLENIRHLQRVSGQEEVSFHVSGTEAVMAAVRLARFNTKRKKIVTFSGSYHGWWDGVQPGLGSERSISDCMTLKEMNRASLRAIRWNADDIAGVLVNPVQSFNPNSPPPNDAVLLTSEARQVRRTNDGYGEWLKALREVCTECDVPLIFDEVYSGFRIDPGGAQAYYGVRADLVVYGKTVAAGLPIGVVCGSRALMRRFDPDKPMRIAYVVGTFSGYPAAMGAMSEFLSWLSTDEARETYAQMNEQMNRWVQSTNTDLQSEGLPIRIAHLGSIFTIEFVAPSRYNWLLQYYLRAQGINLSWVGTGRCLISFDFAESDFNELRAKITDAAVTMRSDGWWLTEEQHPGQSKIIGKQLAKDMMKSVVAVPEPVRSFYQEVMRRKHDDHVASHNNQLNQFLHLISSSVFILCYVLIFSDLVLAMWLGLASLFLRQAGHALIEPPCHDKEQLLLGFDTRSKTVIVALFILIPIVNAFLAPSLSGTDLTKLVQDVAVQWSVFTALVIVGRVFVLIKRHGLRNALVWFVKLITDPFTDVKAYYPSARFNRG